MAKRSARTKTLDAIPEKDGLVVGIDLGDRSSEVCVLEGTKVVGRFQMPMTREGIRGWFSVAPLRIALEAGPQSQWVERELKSLGHRVIVGNPRRTALISASRRKSDREDAEKLARLLGSDEALLYGIEHRDERAQSTLSVIRARDLVVKLRSQSIAHTRAVVKTMGYRLPSCDAESFVSKVQGGIPAELLPALGGMVAVVGALSEQIARYDKQLEELVRTSYPQAAALMRISGVGALTALCFVLVLGRRERFTKSRSAGAYLGLAPARSQSGDHDPQLGISREGNALARRLLVQAAHYILGPFGPPCDLRSFGERMIERAGPKAKAIKKRATVAVARKLAVMMHRLWTTGEAYDPHYSRRRTRQSTAA